MPFRRKARGSWCFAYGLPNTPYIQSILPHGLSLPKVPKGDLVWQHSEAAQQRVGRRQLATPDRWQDSGSGDRARG